MLKAMQPVREWSRAQQGTREEPRWFWVQGAEEYRSRARREMRGRQTDGRGAGLSTEIPGAVFGVGCPPPPTSEQPWLTSQVLASHEKG